MLCYVTEESVPTDYERMGHPVKDWYSIIISGVSHVIKPPTVKPKIVKIDEHTGNQRIQDKGSIIQNRLP